MFLAVHERCREGVSRGTRGIATDTGGLREGDTGGCEGRKVD